MAQEELLPKLNSPNLHIRNWWKADQLPQIFIHSLNNFHSYTQYLYIHSTTNCDLKVSGSNVTLCVRMYSKKQKLGEALRGWHQPSALMESKRHGCTPCPLSLCLSPSLLFSSPSLSYLHIHFRAIRKCQRVQALDKHRPCKYSLWHLYCSKK